MTATAATTTMKAASRQVRDNITAQRQKAVDEYGKLVAKMAPHKATITRIADLAKAIRGWAADVPPHQDCTFSGNRFVCQLGPNGSESHIRDIQEVYTLLGHDKFLLFCSMTLKALEAAGGDLALLTVKKQTGSRPLTVTPKTKK